MSGSANGIRAGTPSTTTPIAGPWLSPQVVKRNSVPKLLPAIGPTALRLSLSRTAGEGGRGHRPRPGEGVAACTTLTLPALRAGSLPLPQCRRGANGCTQVEHDSHHRDVRRVDGLHADDV